MNRVGSLQVYSKPYITRSLEVIDTHYWQVVYIPVTGGREIQLCGSDRRERGPVINNGEVCVCVGGGGGGGYKREGGGASQVLLLKKKEKKKVMGGGGGLQLWPS